jgi:WD40 repeat protein/serine/threonine protein kinase/DNA-binding XRE family transcriptional regulator
MSQDISFGKIVKEYRFALGLTQAELSIRVGCATITIRKIEADQLRPSYQIAEILARALNIPQEDQNNFVRLARTGLRDTPTPSPIPIPPLLPEEIGEKDLSGRAVRGYALGERIGTGGYGVVYQASQPILGREVAIKVILPHFANQPHFIRSFEAEARLVARLEHPHIIPLYDYWREPSAAFLIMRLLHGGSLRTMLQDGPLSLSAVSGILEQICPALHFAHQMGIIHRDIKPSNILLDQENNAYLADFGIAKNIDLLNSDDEIWHQESYDMPAYLAPEQIRAEPINPQTDIYCLGILIYELLTGQPPFRRNRDKDTIDQHLFAPLPPLSDDSSDFPHELNRLVQQAAAKNPAERHPDVITLLGDFQASINSFTATTIKDLTRISDELATENPYKGLRSFEETDASDFFGREVLVQELLGRLAESDDLCRFLAVVGPSGSGKSSVVKAGLIPALRRGGLPGSEAWFLVDFTPGSQPLEELSATLMRVASHPPQDLLARLQKDERGLLRSVRHILPADEQVDLVLVVDQFEEIFTLVDDEGTRAHFLASLLTAVLDPQSRLRVIITLRADFTDRPLQYVDFGELLRRRTEFVLPLTPDELESAISGPAQHRGLSLEQGLIPTIIHDVDDQPGALPLLQYALTELFERRSGQLLTLQAYRESGGALGALGHRAEKLYAALGKGDQEMTRQLFLRLVTLGEGVEDTRRRVLRSELEALSYPQYTNRVAYAGNQLGAVIQSFGLFRLLTFDRDPATRGPTVEVAHEALLREWSRLRRWLDESRSDVRQQRFLALAAAEWYAAGKDKGFLLRGSRLDQFADWAVHTSLALTGDEHAFLDACLEERRARQAAEAVRLAWERALEQRSLQRLRIIVLVLVVASIAATILSTAVFSQSQTARRNETAAQQSAALATIAQGRALYQAATAEAAQGEAVIQAGLAATRSAEAAESALEAEVQRTNALEQQEIAERQARDALEAYSISLSAHARQALENLDTDTALALALAAIDITDPPQEAIETLQQVAFAPGAQRQFMMTNAAGETDEILSLAVSPNGETALVGFAGGNLVLLNIETGETIHTFTGHSDEVVNVVFSPDGTFALSAGCDAQVILWDIATGNEVRRFREHTGCVYALAINPDGDSVVSGSFAGDDYRAPGELFLWDLASGQVLRRLEGGHVYGLRDAVFSPDGRTILSSELSFGGGGDPYGSPLILWEVASGEIIHRFPAPNDQSHNVAFHPDGRTALSTTINRIYLWDLQTGEQLRVFEEHDTVVRDVAFSPNGRRFMTTDYEGSVILWDFESGLPIVHFEQNDLSFVAFRPDGRSALTGSVNGSLVLWDLFPADEVRQFEGQEGGISDIAISPDGQRVISASMSDFRFNIPREDYSLRVWEIETGVQVQVLKGHTNLVAAVEISPNGRQAISVSWDRTLRLWDLASGAEILRAESPAILWDVVFLPDGKRALTATGEPSMMLWNLETGEIMHHYSSQTGKVWTVALSPDGKLALSGSDGGVILWDVASGAQIRNFSVDNASPVHSVVYSPDGRYALGGLADGRIIVWDIANGEVVRVFNEHQGIIDLNMVDMGSDERTVVSSSWHGEVLVWDLVTGQVLHRFASRENLPAMSAITPDGRFVLAGSQDLTITMWEPITLQLDELLAWIEANRVVSQLTCPQRERYGVEPLCDVTTSVHATP